MEIKKKLAIIAVLFICNLFLYRVQSQVVIGSVWLHTPNGTPVLAIEYEEMTANDILYWTNFYKNDHQEVILLDSATYKYNCHSYAWNMLEGGQKCWLNYLPDLHHYWDDGSYEETTEENAEIILYPLADHSAIKSHIPGMYESKWGQCPLYIHSPNDAPYDSIEARTYYRRVNRPVSRIQGSTNVCYGGEVFTLRNPPPGMITWTVTNHFSFSPNESVQTLRTTDSVVTVYRIGVDYFYNGTLSAYHSLKLDSVVIVPCMPAISGDDEVCCDGSVFTLINPPPGAIYWTVSDTTIFKVVPQGNPTIVTYKGTGTKSVDLLARTDSENGPVAASMDVTPCPLMLIFENRTITTDSILRHCGDIIVRNVTVTNNAKLTIETVGNVTFDGGFGCTSGATYEIKKINQ